MASKEQVIKEKAGNWDFIRIKNLGAANDAIKKVNNKPQNGRKDVKIIYWTSNLHAEHTVYDHTTWNTPISSEHKNSYNSMIKTEITLLENHAKDLNR